MPVRITKEMNLFIILVEHLWFDSYTVASAGNPSNKRTFFYIKPHNKSNHGCASEDKL